jgi:inorganic triphosphatase YgiF
MTVPPHADIEAREIELKLELAPGDLPRLQRHPVVRQQALGRAATRLLRSVYFDTPELDLAGRGIALRVRRVGRSYVQTVKARGAGGAGLFERIELEAPVGGEHPDLERIPDLALRAQLQRELAGKTLEPVIETEIRRSHRRLAVGGSEVALDVDVGEIRTRRGNEPICEVELELERGEPAALYELALALHEDIPLRLAPRSKAERGYARLTGIRPAPRKARRLALSSDATLEDLLAEGMREALDHIVSNEVIAREAVDPEGVHQMRVGLRRLRSALALLRPMLPAEAVASFQTELRWLTSELGVARDLDVFLEETLEPLQQRFAQDGALKRLRDEARELRAESYGHLRAALDSPRYSHAMLLLGHWLARCGWREQPLSADSARLFVPAREVTGALLGQRERKVRHLGRHLRRRSAQEKHALRVRLKKLRYAAEFLAGVHPPGRADRYLRRLAELQDVLGHLNDGATAERLLGEVLEWIGPEATAEHHRAAGFVGGWTARGAEEALQQLGRHWKAFARTDPFWREE